MNLVVASVTASIFAASSIPVNAEEWTFSATPYLWAVNLDGDQTVMGTTAELDVGFIDILKESDSLFALQGHFELNNGTWGVFIDPTYAALTMSGDVGPIDVDIDFNYTLVEFGVTYRVARWPGEGGQESVFDVLAGGRYTSLEVDVDLTLIPTSFGTSIGGDPDWIDPFVGGRVAIAVSDGVKLLLRGDIGGFGVGSDITYNVIGGVGWDMTVFGNDATLLVGYRVLYQDYEDGSGANRFAYDVTTHGPILGMTFRF